MGRFWLTACLLGWAAYAAGSAEGQAPDRRFPYEAVLDVDQEYVRCGPGPKYYPTSKLERGARVVVHRHDPGGWAMIAPPADSFSWIQAEYVQKAASGRGSLTANNVIVHVGSALGGERSVYQRTLSRGDVVEVLDEQSFVNERGPVRMYKIKPPAREYRWIAAKSLAAPGGATTTPQAPRIPGPQRPAPLIQGPIATDLQTDVADVDEAFAPSPFGPASTSGPGMQAAPVSSTADVPAVSPFGAEARPAELSPEAEHTLETLRAELAAVDQRFRTMLQAEPQTWDLAGIKAEYVRLEQAAKHPAFTSHIQQRLGTIQRYSKIQADYREFHRLTTATQQRDAELQALQLQEQRKLEQAELAFSQRAIDPSAGMFANPNADPLGANFAQSGQQFIAPGPAPQMAASNAVPTPIASNQTAIPATAPSAAPSGNRFSGAGIVQRSSIAAAGVPAYMLMAPDGRLLAYLEAAPGVDLTTAQNQALGIIGERSFREQLQADVIVVRGVQPIALRAGPMRQ